MAGPAGTPPDLVTALFEALRERPWAFGFFQALRRLEVGYRSRPRLGEAALPADEPIRLTQEPSLAFAPAALSGFSYPAGDRPARLAVRFFGLFGPQGPLPLHLTEYARQRMRDAADPAFSRFADLFHHRLLLLFYRAWANSEPCVSHDRPALEDDHFARYVASLVGLGLPSLRRADQDLAELRSYFAGRLAMQSRNVEGLLALLADVLRLPVRIDEFVGAWIEIPEPARWRLGPGHQPGRLGESAVLGRRSWQRAHKFRIVLGPLNAEDFDSLLPGGPGLERLRALVKSYVGDELCWDVRLLTENQARQPVRLGRAGRLGWSSWLGPRPTVQPFQDVIIEPERLAA
jgi:type VI secretion system protein ImpH